MRKCMAYWCKSGYKTCSETFQIFTVSSDKKMIKLWQIAILRDNIKLKPGDAVCAKHFNPEDVLYERLTYASDGTTVLGRSAYERPRLRKGALPSINLGGLTLGCAEIKILEDCLHWLNAWEEKVNNCSLRPTDFLTPQTAEGLRMTLNSTLDLTKYLLQDLKMDAVYTGRINQDSLEVLESTG